ncbi:anthranilate synthase family protein [Virgisporangium ochraceum]|uniref:anthranilate synthase n=1 Tax=Virgisporangium ochraceum TaxID=65505 RepID=A0A8J3ZPR8_9ACTN|nr:anthranilate synthase family protein [Virgisporangium ochraceum]GIJ66015.1 phenazine-specific anthranilate synthase component I [Virgisporangium ochraceum]
MIPQSGPFAIIRRAGRELVEIFQGDRVSAADLASVPISDSPGPSTLALVPYRQVAERGFECVDDGAPLECLRISSSTEVLLADLLAHLPTDPPVLRDSAFDIDDDGYAALVGEVLAQEIGRGEGSNFVIHRVFEASVEGPPLRAALAAFARLLRDERGAYWTFVVHTGTRTLVGATPERHVSVDDGLVMMNPISGTFRHGDGFSEDDLLAFLDDPKEIDELYMVLDEELKMMAVVAEGGGQVIGPQLAEMAHLHHTEYLLAGRTTLDVRDVLRETMFAPTVVGSPIENACRVVARHERRGRGYYGAVLALLGHDDAGRQTLDAPILIRTAELSPSGKLRIPVGATLVRHSTADGEVAETHAKAAGILRAFTATPSRDLGHFGIESDAQASKIAESSAVLAALAARNRHLARFWLDQRPADPASGASALIVDAEDTFTGMLAHLFRALGLAVERVPVADALALDLDAYDLVVAGPGPGDPRSRGDARVDGLRTLARQRLATGRPLLGVCLGHQVISGLLGLPLHRKDGTYQGTQREIDFFGRRERVGFYSTFLAVDADAPVDPTEAVGLSPSEATIEVSRDPVTREVHAMRGTGFATVQFHPESVLTEYGVDLLGELLDHLGVRVALSQ